MISLTDVLRARILIVDDQEANIHVLEQMLAEAGYDNVASTTRPQELFALHREQRCDLILLDLQMQGMDGSAVMEGLKAIASDRQLPVLVFTAEPGQNLVALRTGARDYISKPFDLVELKTRIHNLLEMRLLYQQLEDRGKQVETAIQERTAELRASEERYRSLTELASDWYWEQDENGTVTKVSGPALEMLGIGSDGLPAPGDASADGWNEAERESLRSAIAQRRPFLDFIFSRANPDGSRQKFQVSGEPMFGPACRFLGYRGIGLEITHRE